VKKEILASLMSSRPWRQVVSINRWRQDVLSVKMSGIKSVVSRCRVCYCTCMAVAKNCFISFVADLL